MGGAGCMSRVRGGDVRTVFLFVTFPEGRIITAGGGGGDIFTSGGFWRTRDQTGGLHTVPDRRARGQAPDDRPERKT